MLGRAFSFKWKSPFEMPIPVSQVENTPMKCGPSVSMETTKTRESQLDAFRGGYLGDVRFRGVP
jgi:hypothetical protein